MGNVDGLRLSPSAREGRLEVMCVNKRVSRRKVQEKADLLAKILDSLLQCDSQTSSNQPHLGICGKCRVSGPHLTSRLRICMLTRAWASPVQLYCEWRSSE